MSWNIGGMTVTELPDSGQWIISNNGDNLIKVHFKCEWEYRKLVMQYLVGSGKYNSNYAARKRHPWSTDYVCIEADCKGLEPATNADGDGTILHEFAEIWATFKQIPRNTKMPDVDFQIDVTEEFILLPAGTKSKTTNIRSQGNDHIIVPMITYRIVRWVPYEWINVAGQTNKIGGMHGAVNSVSMYLPFRYCDVETVMFSGMSVERKSKYNMPGYNAVLIFKVRTLSVAGTAFNWNRKLDLDSSGVLTVAEFSTAPYTKVDLAGVTTDLYSINSFLYKPDEAILSGVSAEQF
jgi:hypothetical protein